MACTHERLRCVNNVYFCAACGAKIEPKPQEEPAEKKPAAKQTKRGKSK